MAGQSKVHSSILLLVDGYGTGLLKAQCTHQYYFLSVLTVIVSVWVLTVIMSVWVLTVIMSVWVPTVIMSVWVPTVIVSVL